MNDRIRQLRDQSVNSQPSLSPERAMVITEFYQSDEAQAASPPVKRALAFKYLLERKTICITPGELIVGERGPAPLATPTYPEICIHSLQDLDLIHSRPKVPFTVDAETRKLYEEIIIPYWQGKSLRERIFENMSPAWHDAYESGIFTEFQEQRAPGHTVLGAKIYSKGMIDIKADIQSSLAGLDFFHDPDAYEKREELRAMDIAADAIILFAKRHAAKLRELAEQEPDIVRQQELIQMAAICDHVPAHAPRTFWEALQYYWFVHVGVVTELNPWDSFNPGRLDQHLYPFYTKGLADGTLTPEWAKELLQAFWVKFNNHPSPPKVGVTAKESNTYTDFALINIGGVTADGADAVNDLSYLILDVIEEMRILQPSSMIQLSKKNPDRLLKRALKIIKTGFGQPAIFNTDAIVQELLRQGKSVEDARNGGCSGCVESGAFGVEAYILTGYFNLPKILEVTLHNGVDPRTGTQIGLPTGNPAGFSTFDDLLDAYTSQLRYFIDIKIQGNNIIDRIYARHMPVPFLSLLIDDCVARGKDYLDGGARYNTSYIQGVGLGSITDALTALKYHLFEQRTVKFSELLDALHHDFQGYEALQHQLLNATPKYGNDDEYADHVLKQVFDIYYAAVNGRPNTRGGTFRINLLPTTCHVYFGSVTGALPDGRKAYTPLSEGISPVQGADQKGPTAVLKSAAKIDHIKTGGTLLNQKFTPQFLDHEDGLQKIAHLVRSYFKMDGHHLQFNVVKAETLREAQRHPDQYRDLIVRVAGYSDYFVDLTEELQNEIIKRTEHQGY
ncbi:formate C-acetyltransferase/glycerol dehydratase family glycyl radical enzyme [candidate division KSB3 bacterium]|uniref:Formate C-acetyltransferase/glycerol dehydratase family glycyl radical enzyme n=1 Tax=candidate division KSB3 bacterium TaxID=2044937 RepID=A0A9D5JSP6_9BACT|nr:formate C-acetyltransferase/glycerol dehydratase family glycyl radical enzyme [candidate division KSB3 bacterium]MBD3323544.1 formate C-acetyltransferase/glycerol dehydratase family glycyl radical enzyme [candidate division KSB3 bacterium]